MKFLDRSGPALPTESFVAENARSPRMDDGPLPPKDLCLLVYRQMRAFTGPSRDLDDLAQTALEQILRADFQGRSKFSTFSHGVCYRVWLKHLRFKVRFRARFAVEEEAEEAPTCDADPETLLEARRRFVRLYEALESLPPKGRAVVSLRDIMGREISEIAEIVGANEATVRTRLRDGRNKLRALLEGDKLFDRSAGDAWNEPALQEAPCPQN